jgi:hypothetical protein
VTPTLGTLPLEPYRPELVAAPVAALLAAATDVAEMAFVAEIDPALADTQALNGAFALDADLGANCADVNGLVRRTLDVRKCSFAPQDWAVAQTGVEHGGITPVGVPSGWPILVDRAVTEQEWIVVGSGLRRSKLVLPGAALAALPGAQVLDGLGVRA